MARIDGFHLPPEAWREPYVLEGGEARHLLTVLRARPGTRVRLFDGCGREGLFELISGRKDVARLAPLEVRNVERPASRLTIALGFSKAGRRDWLLEKAVELQVGEIVFWQAAHSQGLLPETVKRTWRETCIAAAKQCGAVWLPEITLLPSGATAVAEAGTEHGSRLLLWEKETKTVLSQDDLAGSVFAVVGPEGGLAEAETRTFLDAGFASRHLGPSILRLETAALLVMGLHYHARIVKPETS